MTSNYCTFWSLEPVFFLGLLDAGLLRCVSGSVTGVTRHLHYYVMRNAARNRLTGPAKTVGVTLLRSIVYNARNLVIALCN